MPITPKQIEPSATQSSVEFYSVPKEHLKSSWKVISPVIEKALDYAHGKATLRGIFESLMEERSQLFVAADDHIRLAWITEVEVYPESKVLCIKFAGGVDVLPFLKEAFSMMERWALELGCDAIEIHGRPGWEKLLKMERTSVTLRKKIGANK